MLRIWSTIVRTLWLRRMRRRQRLRAKMLLLVLSRALVVPICRLTTPVSVSCLVVTKWQGKPTSYLTDLIKGAVN